VSNPPFVLNCHSRRAVTRIAVIGALEQEHIEAGCDRGSRARGGRRNARG
jgi:hypothetical protein